MRRNDILSKTAEKNDELGKKIRVCIPDINICFNITM